MSKYLTQMPKKYSEFTERKGSVNQQMGTLQAYRGRIDKAVGSIAEYERKASSHSLGSNTIGAKAGVDRANRAKVARMRHRTAGYGQVQHTGGPKLYKKELRGRRALMSSRLANRAAGLKRLGIQ